MSAPHRPSDAEVSPARPRIEPLGPNGLRAWAPAKINLNLLVGPRRSDGFHEIDSIVVKVTLYDRIDLRLRDDGRISLRCEGADCGPDGENLAMRAAELLGQHRRGSAGVDIELRKAIPPGGGLGGGSSDAAAVLTALDRLWDVRLPGERLAELAATLGSDVPLFLGGPCSRVTGRGERIEPAAVHPLTVVLCLGDCVCPTADVYRAFDADPQPMGEQPDISTLAERPPSAWREGLPNQLSRAARRVCPRLAQAWDAMQSAIAMPMHLTGSGGSLFVLCDDQAQAAAVCGAVPSGLPWRMVIVRENPW